MLDFGEILGSPHSPLQTLVIELVGRCSRGAPSKDSANGNTLVFFRHVLMDDIVREAGERRAPAVKKRFDFIGSRVLVELLENVGSLFLAQH